MILLGFTIHHLTSLSCETRFRGPSNFCAESLGLYGATEKSHTNLKTTLIAELRYMYFAFFSSKFQQKSFWIIESSFCFKTLSMSPVQVFFVPRKQWRGITTAKGSHSIILAFFARLFSGKRRQWLSKPGNRSLQWSENAILMDDFQHTKVLVVRKKKLKFSQEIIQHSVQNVQIQGRRS